MALGPIDRQKYGNWPKSLCWDCARACPKTCSWARDFITVEGWVADKRILGDGVETYMVHRCPEYIEDGRDRELDTDGCLNLISELLKVARMDYVKGLPGTVQEVEQFFRGKGAAKVHMLKNPEGVIKELKKQRKMYQQKRLSLMKG